jgi:hypothetical protein
MTDLKTQQTLFVRQVRDLVTVVSARLSATAGAEAMHLVEHNEHGEALRTLAWCVVNENTYISQQAYDELRNLSQGLVAASDMPESLAQHIKPDP